MRKLRVDPVWSRLPAVQSGNIITVSNELSYASPNAQLAFLDELEAAVTAWAASGTEN